MDSRLEKDWQDWLEKKLARTSVPVHPLIQTRWSPRAFLDKPVPEAYIRGMLEAARWAPSSYNDQPWRFIVGDRYRDPVTWERIYRCLVEFNRQWTKTVPVLMIALAKKHLWDRLDVKNAHAWHDVGLATAQLILQARAYGLYVHVMGGFDGECVRRVFGVPETFDPVTAIAVGYLGDPDQLPGDLAESERAERDRLPLRAIAFRSRFGVPWSEE